MPTQEERDQPAPLVDARLTPAQNMHLEQKIKDLTSAAQALEGRVVLLPWVRKLPWKMQSTLLSGLRGPDTAHLPNLKAVVRWLRPVTQNNADPETDYMRIESPEWSSFKKELEFCTMHYFGHLLHAMEIIAYKHPDSHIRARAASYYMGMADDMHLNVETEAQLDERLK